MKSFLLKAGAGCVVAGCVLLLSSLFAEPPGAPEPLLVQTGWTSARTDIPLSELKEAYCSGRARAAPRARSDADRLFQCAGVSAEIRDFYPKSKDQLILSRLSDAEPRLKTLSIDGVSFFDAPMRYALSTGASAVRSDVTHYILTGVSALTRYTGKSADENGVAVLTEKVRPFFLAADYVHVSNEVSFMPGCVFAPGTRFCSKEPHFRAYQDIRANIVELTGNHTRDFGDEPFLKTIGWFEKNGMRIFGGGRNKTDAERPLVLPLKGGGSIALTGYNELCPLKECAEPAVPGANRYTDESAARTIRALRKKGDFVFATVQFGEVSSYKPTESQRRISYHLIDAGADLVFGSQAHQVQQMEFYRGKIILHGLGNFLFDQTHTFGLRQGYFMNLYFYRGRLVSMHPVFTWIDEKFRPVPATREQALKIQESIYSDELLYK